MLNSSQLNLNASNSVLELLERFIWAGISDEAFTSFGDLQTLINIAKTLLSSILMTEVVYTQGRDVEVQAVIILLKYIKSVQVL